MESESPIQEMKTHQTDDTILASRSNLGTIQLRNAHTKEIILIPTPSNDPNDPLNWLDIGPQETFNKADSVQVHSETGLRDISRYTGDLHRPFLFCRSLRCHSRHDRNVFWQTWAASPPTYFEDRLLHHYSKLDAGHWEYLLDALGSQIWTPASVRLYVPHVYWDHGMACTSEIIFK